jgi:uncharacterized lipoprotein YmbA
MIRKPMTILMVLVLSACAATPVELSYYMLASPVPRVENIRELSDKPTIVIESVELAAFLRQPGFVIQSGNNQLEVSKRHLWAESLEQAVPKVLFRQLQLQSRDYVYYVKFMDFVPRTDYRLRLHIDNLQATDSGDVIAAGRYQLIANTDTTKSVTADFYFTRDLEEDGHDHAVQQLRILIGDIAEAVLESTNNLVIQLVTSN